MKTIEQILIGLIVCLMLSSCVYNKKITYLQKNDLGKRNITRDSITRRYSIEPFNYRIQSNDILSIRFLSRTSKEFDIAQNYFPTQGSAISGIGGGANAQLIGELVDEHGEIPFPVIGKVKVAGLTVFEIQEQLQEIASKFLESPIVKVRVMNYQATILGQVKSEGVVTLPNNRATILEALALAGGLDDLADREYIKLIRQKNNQVEVQYINLLDENFINSPYYYVYQNDMIIVPPLKQRSFRKYFGENLTLFLSSLSVILLTLNLLKK